MNGNWAIPVIASVLILGGFGLIQDATADDLQGVAQIAGMCGADADPAVTDLDTLFNFVPSGDFEIMITNTGNAPAEFRAARTLCLNDMDVDRPCTLKFAADPGVSFADKTEVPVDPASTQLAEVVPAFTPITRQFDWRLELETEQDILDDADKDQRVTVTVSAICDRVDGNPRQVCPDGTTSMNGNCVPFSCIISTDCNDGNLCTDDSCVNNICVFTSLGGASCNTGVPGVCAAGTQICRGGTVTCESNTGPTTLNPDESVDGLCNGLDDNCDDSVDEGCTCTAGQTRQCGTTEVGVCQLGTQSCNTFGTFDLCIGNIEPTTEVLDGIDNNCDGVIDEGFTAAPTGLTATTGPLSGQVTLSWTAPADGGFPITDYVIKFRTTGTAIFTVFPDGISTETTVAVIGLTPGSSFEFEVSAVNAIGTGPPSTAVATAGAATAPTACDPNGNGEITAAELLPIIQQSDPTADLTDVEFFINLVELNVLINVNGVIDTPEELAFLNIFLGQEPGFIPCTVSATTPTACDPNGNGSITGTELENFINDLAGEIVALPGDGDLVIQLVETDLGASSNGNGIIDSQAELDALNAQILAAIPGLPPCTIDEFGGGSGTTCDPNDDGSINATELTQFLIPLDLPFGEPLTVELVRVIILQVEASVGGSINELIDTPIELFFLNEFLQQFFPDIEIVPCTSNVLEPPSCDAGPDGFISPDELLPFFLLLLDPAFTLQDAEDFIATIDTNGNGVIDNQIELDSVNQLFGGFVTCTL